jgi:DNA-binding NarL/FixJ family response regulator
MSDARTLDAMLVDPSLFTAPYDAALTQGLIANGISPTWMTRPTRRADRQELPAGLTARERQVLGLLGQGMSNRRIAGQLHITENTTANHVRSILMKTGAANRTQAAMFASSHGLLS